MASVIRLINCIDSRVVFKVYFSMPVIFRYKGYRFLFFANEGNPREPLHVHVRKGERLAKFWVEPQIALAEAYGFRPGELTMLAKIIEAKQNLIKRSWHEFFG